MVDKNEAPEGYEAVGKDENGFCCTHCVFNVNGCIRKDICGAGITCSCSDRKDKEEVYFIKKAQPVIPWKEKTIESKLNEISIGECLPISNGLYATKIPQGWIYESIDESGTSGGCCFVPETKEVDWEKGHGR